jgi:hypothetical protein
MPWRLPVVYINDALSKIAQGILEARSHLGHALSAETGLAFHLLCRLCSDGRQASQIGQLKGNEYCLGQRVAPQKREAPTGQVGAKAGRKPCDHAFARDQYDRRMIFSDLWLKNADQCKYLGNLRPPHSKKVSSDWPFRCCFLPPTHSPQPLREIERCEIDLRERLFAGALSPVDAWTAFPNSRPFPENAPNPPV